MKLVKRFMRCLLVFALVQAMWASQSFAESKEDVFPVITAQSLYVGDMPEYMEQVWLYLLEDNYFILKKTRSASGKSKALTQFTGRWRQIDGGANLQLTNVFGLQMNMNIGSSGKLYSSVQAASMSARTLVMKKSPFSSPMFRISAVLESRNGHLVLTDSAAGRTFSPVEGDLDNAALKVPLFIEADVTLLKKGIKLEKIYSTTENIPSSIRHKDGNFDDLAGATIWQSQGGDGFSPASCYFRKRGSGTGVLEVSGPGLHLELPYRVEQQHLVFVAEPKKQATDISVEGGRWLKLLSGQVLWRNEGELLVLQSPAGHSIQLTAVKSR